MLSGYVSGGSSVVLRHGSDGVVVQVVGLPLPVCLCLLMILFMALLWPLLFPGLLAGVVGFAVLVVVLRLLNVRLPCLLVCLPLMPVRLLMFWWCASVFGWGCSPGRLPLPACGRGPACGLGC